MDRLRKFKTFIIDKVLQLYFILFTSQHGTKQWTNIAKQLYEQ